MYTLITLLMNVGFQDAKTNLRVIDPSEEETWDAHECSGQANLRHEQAIQINL
jgi:hypothetical protein